MKLYISIILISIVACDNKPKTELLTGDLYFSFFRFGSYYNHSDSAIEKFEIYFDTVSYEKASDGDKRLLNNYEKVKEEKLLYHPFVDILTEKDSVVTLYLEARDYDEIKKHKRKELQDENKKLRIEADVKKIGDGLFYCNDLIKVQKIDGETLMKQKKIKIEDYK